MPRLSFQVKTAAGVSPAAQPTIVFTLAVHNAVVDEVVQSIALRVQLRIDPARRRYSADEERGLVDLFGAPSRWKETVSPLLWTHATTTVPAFVGETAAELSVPCSWDFDAGAARYFHAVKSGDVPLLLLFSGTTLYVGADGRLQVDPLPFSAEARFALPSSTWTAALDGYAPGAAALLLSRDLLERLDRHRRASSLPTLEAALERLVPP